MSTALTGIAGEYFVLYKLHALGALANHAPRNWPTADIVMMRDGKHPLQVQVKTKARAKRWSMSVKHESLSSPNLFYVFVDLMPLQPMSFIIPSQTVASVVHDTHRAWLATPGKDGQRHNDNDMRSIAASYPFGVPGLAERWMDQWQENWELLFK